jgi:hypothetical protein
LGVIGDPKGFVLNMSGKRRKLSHIRPNAHAHSAVTVEEKL